MTTTDWIQAASMVVLVAVTTYYACQARRTVSEMKKQRYDALRPVIDIQMDESPEAKVNAGFAAQKMDFAWGLSCELRNIGPGPAVDIHSFIQVQKNKHRCWDFGTLAKDQKTDNPKSLSINKKGDRNYMAVYYKDVFGRNSESSREVKPTKEKAALEIGPLKTVLVKESKPK